jgi:hypothetical protein
MSNNVEGLDWIVDECLATIMYEEFPGKSLMACGEPRYHNEHSLMAKYEMDFVIALIVIQPFFGEPEMDDRENEI